jgi:hypothetical protein
MIRTDKNLEELLKKIEPISNLKKIKLSEFRHPCHIQEDHDLVKERIKKAETNV